MCHYLNVHQGHKTILIKDEEELKKENITIESSSKEFNKYIEKSINLKDKIEKEITEIDKLYEIINDKVTKFYLKKHEELLNEENNLKEKLQNEVTKIKEKLEFFLNESNRIIKTSENINKGVKIIGNEKDKNMIKVLSYVSKIQKSQKEMNKLLQELMKNLKISFDEKNKIIYKEYYFNGIQIPKNIQFKEVGTNSFKVFWEIDNINNKDINNNTIKFRVEKREENENEKFIQIYEGNNLNCLIDKLNKNTFYEIRICCVFNDLIGQWSKTHTIKTLMIESDILMRSKKEDEFLNKIYEWSGYKGMELIKDQPYVYMRIVADIFLEDMHPFLGQILGMGILLKTVLFLH